MDVSLQNLISAAWQVLVFLETTSHLPNYPGVSLGMVL